MRRLIALLLIAASGWLLYQTSEVFIGSTSQSMSADLWRTLSNPRVILPLAGGFMGLLGGLIAFFGGAGGAAIAMIGGLVAAGVSLYLGASFSGREIWNNEAVVGIVILVLSGVAALIGRD